MLHMFAMVLKCFSGVFASVSDACFKCFICLLCMLQLLHLNVSKIDRVLHMKCVWEAAGGAGDVQGGAGLLLWRSLASLTCWVTVLACLLSEYHPR
jgi:hypothetical protein